MCMIDPNGKESYLVGAVSNSEEHLKQYQKV